MRKHKFFLVYLLFILLISLNIQEVICLANSDSESLKRKENWIEDLNYFQDHFFKECKSFPDDSVLVANQIIESIKDSLMFLSDERIQLLISKAVSVIDDAHTTVFFRNFNQIPMRLFLFEDGLYVLKTHQKYESFLGKEVVKICNRTVSEILDVTDQYLSGNKSWIKNRGSFFLASPDFYFAAGLSQTNDSIELTFRDGDGFTNIYLKPDSSLFYFNEYNTWKELSPESGYIKSDYTCIHVLDTFSSLPLYLQNLDKLAHVQKLKIPGSLYIQINKCTRIKGLIKKVKDECKEHCIENVIVDLRFNSGGNFLELVKITKTIPRRINGKVYIIIGKPTFSAGICTAARLKYYGGEKAIVVGEEAGDRLQFWAEGKSFNLPNSQITIRATNGHHDWKDNKFKLFETFWLNLIFGVAVEDLSPDIEIELLFKDYIQGEDAVLNKIESLMKSNL